MRFKFNQLTFLAWSAALVPISFACVSASTFDDDDRFRLLISEYTDGVGTLHLPELQFSYVDTINAQLDGPPSHLQLQFFESFAARVEQVRPELLSACHRVFLDVLNYEIASNLWRVRLVAKHRREAAGRRITNGGIRNHPLGAEWYPYLLDRWLNVDLTPEQLLQFGERELADALDKYRRIQDKLGYRGSNAEFRSYLASDEFRVPEGETPLPRLLAIQQTVWNRIGRLFAAYPIVPATIRESDFGDTYPVDAYYVDEEEVFYFNLLKEGFRTRETELMFLHEATPGHHMQNVHKNEVAGCNTLLPGVYYHGYTEGWATYSETLGKELGLYEDLTSYLGWVEWDLVRSIRVILDVRINHHGWSFGDALEYWHRVMPGDREIAEREIRRVIDWPAQAITYKVGAEVFESGRRSMHERKGKDFDVRSYHDRALRYGALPLGVLRSVLEAD